MPTLLLAYDGSDPARSAIARAAVLAPGADAVVATVAHGLAALEDAASGARVAMPDDVIRSAVARLRKTSLDETRALAEEGARIAADAGLKARPKPVPADGPAWAGLADAAREESADLIACGSHGHGMVARAIVGSVSTALARNAALPVLVVPEDPPDAGGPLLIGYDGSDGAERAIAACGRLAGGRPAIVAYVWRAPIRRTIAGRLFQQAPIDDVRDTFTELDGVFEGWAQETAERGAELAREAGLDARPLVVEKGNPPAHVLLTLADEHDACAVVAGRSGSGGMARAVLGSVSSALLHAAERPVFLA